MPMPTRGPPHHPPPCHPPPCHPPPCHPPPCHPPRHAYPGPALPKSSVANMTIIPIHFCFVPIVLPFLTSPGSSPVRLRAYTNTSILYPSSPRHGYERGQGASAAYSLGSFRSYASCRL